MINLSRLIIGIVFILFGIGIAFAGFFTSKFLLIYSVILIGVGIWILLNKNEDKIEERQDLNKLKTKK